MNNAHAGKCGSPAWALFFEILAASNLVKSGFQFEKEYLPYSTAEN